MVKTSTYYSCGCGFTADNMAAAKKHVEETKHKLDLRGMMVP
ncbi:unnamed protein product [marine sediment metagenome]|uniref:Uncharacterized protein n=1 Tax=marine sediment metagenome TaxID=412755 RepID=X1LVG3_9ZZZZ